MSNAVSALPGATASGFAEVREMGLIGMVTLKADLSAPATKKAVKSATAFDVPDPRTMTGRDAANTVGWMAPDEILILCDYDRTEPLVAALSSALDPEPHLAVNVSDARAVFTISGAGATQILAKLTPADLGTLGAMELRRSRIAQVPAAFWHSGPDEMTLICFRSVARYVFDLLRNAARGDAPGAEDAAI